MPSTSPGSYAAPFAQILPGAPAASLQAFTTFVFRFKRYVAYISGSQLNILSGPNTLIQAYTFNHELVALAAEKQSGKIAVAGTKSVWVLEPHTEGWTKIWWQKELHLRRDDEGDVAHWLSWGDDGEVLIAGDRVLTLFSTLPSSRSSSPAITAHDGESPDSAEERRALWSKSVASPIRQAEFSPSASLISSCGRYDRLVKIWRRLSFEEGLFDYSYLPHPGAVTHIEWRQADQHPDGRRSSGISNRHDDDCEVLFTVACDGLLRIWRTGGLHDLEILTLYTTVDLVAAIPQSPSLTIKGQSDPRKAPRYVVILHADQFSAAVNAAIGKIQDEKVNHSKELLKEMISKEPDVIVAFDGQGRMSAWGIQSIGHKRRPDTPTLTQAYHIAHAEALELRLPFETPAVCGTWLEDEKLHVMTHALCEGGEITWWQGEVETIFSAAATTSNRFTATTVWSGHDSPILELRQSGDSFMSRSVNEVTQWRTGRSQKFKPKLSFGMASDILAATTLNTGQLLLTVSSDCFALWDEAGKRIAKVPHATSSTGSIFAAMNNTVEEGVFVPDNVSEVVRWKSQLLSSSNASGGNLNMCSVRLSTNNTSTPLTHAVLVPMPLSPDETCVVSISKTGLIACHSVPEDVNPDATLEPFAVFHTGVSEAAFFTANEEFAAVVSKGSKDLVLVDLTDGYVEYRQPLSSAVKQLACHTLSPRHNLLTVAHDTMVEILVQGRYDHATTEFPVWRHVKSISISSTGLKLSAVSWLPNCSLALAAGNAVFVTRADIDYKALDEEIREVVDDELEKKQTALPLVSLTQKLKEPLPFWHPNLLSHLHRSGHHGLVMTLLRTLAQRLKFWSAGDALSPTLDEQADTFLVQSQDVEALLDDDTINDLKEQLSEKALPRISRAEQQRLEHMIDAANSLKEHAKGLDSNAMRYLFDWKLQLLSAADESHEVTGSTQQNGVGARQPFVPDMNWREICFAYHSTTQQPLLDILILHYDNKLTWQIARKLGIMAWLSEREALEQVFEQLGQTAYRSDQPPDPVNASLYYLALHKKQTLLALWRIATWHKEQRTTMNFLKRDFSQTDAQTAAKKNAYALMGKRRFHYAAAFFLLAHDPASATSLLAGQCEDAQFAIAVARLYCGDGSPVVQKLLEDRILPRAEKNRDRWLMSWCYSVTLQRNAASEVLVTPLDGVKSWQQDDPMTLLLYKHLRKDPSEHEYDAVLRTARIFRRMGLWLLALEVVSQWEFKPTSLPSTNQTANGLTNGVHNEPKSMLDDYVSAPDQVKSTGPPSVLDDFAQAETFSATPVGSKANREAKAAELLARLKAKKEGAAPTSTGDVKEKPAPTQFKEPDPNSLLDSFGF